MNVARTVGQGIFDSVKEFLRERWGLNRLSAIVATGFRMHFRTKLMFLTQQTK